MNLPDDTRDRVVALEVEVQHLLDKVSSMDAKVTAMHELLLQAKGLRWAIVGVAALAGFISAKLAPFLPWVGGK